MNAVLRATTFCAAVAVCVLGAAGPDSQAQTPSDAIVPFKINVSDSILKDLQERLARTRYPGEIENSAWNYGTNLTYLRELVTYWQRTFDWRGQERKLNSLPQFKTSIDGIDIHFIHQQSSHANATPIVLIHGWPGSVFEFTKVIDRFTNPTRFGGDANDAFHVVALSLPGYGFSGKPRVPGFNPRKMAEVVAQLMARLGYSRYGAQGGDWGGIIVRQLGHVDPTHLIGLHSNMCVAAAPAGDNPNEGVSPEEMKHVEASRAKIATETAYQEIQSTKPMTLGYGLNDSPAGLAAWIVEKFRTWSDSGGDIEKRFTKDELLTNVMIYWVTEAAPSSIRIYLENRVDPGVRGRVEVPFACARFPAEPFANVPRRWVEAQYNVVQYTEMPRGGHFAALEEPELLVDDVRKFFRNLR
jgi:microsomal epoxide hydrolase